jgi:hypothetical protein
MIEQQLNIVNHRHKYLFHMLSKAETEAAHANHAWHTTMKDREEGKHLPFWDKTGMKVEGRFQFRSGCMVRKGNDCGCFLVDTSIETDERSSCTKGEYLSGIDPNPGYGTWDHERVFELQILELVFGECSFDDDQTAALTNDKDQVDKAVKAAVGVAAANAKVAEKAGGEVGDGGKGDFAVESLRVRITNQATAREAGVDVETAYKEASSKSDIPTAPNNCETFKTGVEKALAGSHPAVYIRGYPSICYGAEECAEARHTDVRTVLPTMLMGGDAKHQERCRCGRRLFVPSVSRSRPLAAPCRFATLSGDFMAWRRLRKVVHILAGKAQAKCERPRRIRPRTCHNPRS